nr:calcyclin-binding protein [Leptinotarsa decemlineata]
MDQTIEELKKDIDELRSLEQQATRQKIKGIISIEIQKLTSEVVKLEEKSKFNSASKITPGSSTSLPNTNRRYEVKINNYAWDQTNKFVKFYITLKGVQDIPFENVKGSFTKKSMEIVIEDLYGKDQVLRITNFLKPINPDQCTWKIKKDMVIVNVAKTSPDHWSHITEWEKKASDQKMADIDTDKSDPAQGLMSLMKNMYDKGDDEMKRTIAKAWTESQEKKQVQ